MENSISFDRTYPLDYHGAKADANLWHAVQDQRRNEDLGIILNQEEGNQDDNDDGIFAVTTNGNTSSSNFTDNNQLPILFENTTSFNGTSHNESFFFVGDTLPTRRPSDVTTSIPTIAPSFPPPPPPVEGTGFIESTDTTVLLNTLGVYGSLYIVLMLAFCYLRLRFPKVYNVRSWVPSLQCDLACSRKYGFFSWVWQVFDVDENDILEQCGMDALCFLRVLRMGRKLAIMGCVHAIWLIPVYLTAKESGETYYLEDPLVIISTAHLPSGSMRFLATVVCAYTIFGYTMWLIRQEVQWYTTMRHRFLSQRRPRNYAVYVAGVPPELRSSNKLAEFFRQSGATSSVLEAHIVLACPRLESLVNQRTATLQQLERAKAFEEKHGERRKQLTVKLPGTLNLVNGTSKRRNSKNRPDRQKKPRKVRPNKQRQPHNFVATVDSIEHLETRLRQLTKDIALSYQAMEDANDPRSVEEHRALVMQEFYDFQKAQTLVATRDFDLCQHDMEQAEEIDHTGQSTKTHVKTTSTAKDDKFSRAAEAFFFGTLSPSEQQKLQHGKEDEEREQLMPYNADGRHVTIHTGENNIYYDDGDEAWSDSPSFGGDDDPETWQLDRSKRRQVPFLKDGGNTFRPALGQNSFPSKSTITTVPGTFEGHPHHPHFCDHLQDENDNRNQFFQNPSRSKLKVGDNGDLSDDSSSEDDEYLRVYRGRTSIHQDTDDNDSEVDDLEGSNQSWSNSGTQILRGVQKVGKSVVNASSGMGDTVATAAYMVGDLGVKNVKKASDKVNRGVLQAAEMGVENIKTIRASAAAVVPVVLAHSEGTPLEGGFVVFKDLYSTQAALQMIHHNQAGVMHVEEAPGPDEIFWRNIGLPATARRTGRLLSLAATVTLCLFWTVPISFISALTEVNSLKANIPVLAEWVEEYPATENFLALIAPLMLLLLQDVLLPMFLFWFATWEGHISSSTLEATVFVKYATFVLVQTFFVSAISGSIAAELENMIKEPGKTIQLMANALPAQSSYFLQILVVVMVVTMGLEMIRAVPLGMAAVRWLIAPKLTAGERTQKWHGLHSLQDPREFEHANISGSIVLFFMVFFVYSCLAPSVSFFLLAMFYTMESGFRYQFYHNYPSSPDSGGKHWKGFLYILEAEMIFAQLTMIGFLVLKQSFFALSGLLPLLVITILFIFYVNNYKLYVADHLPTGECIVLDNRHRLHDTNFVKGMYMQPCIGEAQSDEIFEII